MVTQEKYFKVLRHFTVQEWLLLGVKAGLNLNALQNFTSKKQLINYIGKNAPTFFNDLSKPIYFKIGVSDGKEKMTIITDEPAEIASYKEKTNQRWALTDDQINDIIAKDESEFEDVSIEVDSLNDGSAHLSEDVSEHSVVNPPVAQNVVNNISGLYKQKLKYETDMEIGRFLGQVESYAHANGTSDDNKMIAIAVAALNQTDDGAKSAKILKESDFASWDTFKAKISKVLGHSPAYYVNRFNNFQRGSQKLGIALSELIECFRKGWQIEFRDLTPTEEEIIKRKFIHSLSGSLLYMLKTEEKKHNLDSLLDRAIELETCFTEENQSPLINSISAQTHKTHQNSKIQDHSVNNVSEVPDKLTDILQNLQNQHKEILAIQKQCSDAMNRLSLSNRSNQNPFQNQGPPQNFRPSNPYQGLNGLCVHYVRGNQCRYTNCRYKHTGPVSDALRKQFSKQ